MKEKKNNNLIKVEIDNQTFYYTSLNRAAYKLGIQSNSINWAIVRGINPKLPDGTYRAKVSIVDGSEISYKYINN